MKFTNENGLIPIVTFVTQCGQFQRSQEKQIFTANNV